MKILDRIKFSLGGRAIPAIKPLDIDSQGRVKTIQLLTVKERANSLIDSWTVEGWEKNPEHPMITLIDGKGIAQPAYVLLEAGQTGSLYAGTAKHANLKDVIGKAAMVDDIAEALDLNKSLKQMIIGLLIGIGLGAFIIGPMLTQMMK